MMKHIIILIAILCQLSIYAGNPRDTLHTKIGISTIVPSSHLNDSVKIFIHHPFCYKPDKEFPLIILFDANATFKAFSSCTELMAYDQNIPFCLVVGFPQYKYVTGKGEALKNSLDTLISFLSDELMPYLSSRYNITKTLIWGQGDQSGTISSYILFEKPDLFDGYISDIPVLTPIADKILSPELFKNTSNANVHFYIFGNASFTVKNQPFLNNLKNNAPETFKWKYVETNEPNSIIYFLSNYMHALDWFFREDMTK